ncbi:hypothetical protein AB0B66_33630 [Catellatospora sp. NPDC049111]|uniref:hypothetical protein n=1 Tax=Catellatospora sp. NPDC049111 TaxID=3155271 RepID=UPI0033EC1388
MDGQTTQVAQGEPVAVPAGTRHNFRNTGVNPLRSTRCTALPSTPSAPCSDQAGCRVRRGVRPGQAVRRLRPRWTQADVIGTRPDQRFDRVVAPLESAATAPSVTRNSTGSHSPAGQRCAGGGRGTPAPPEVPSGRSGSARVCSA